MQDTMTNKRLLRERGQSLVEMTLGFLVLTLLLTGLLDIGRVYFTYVAMEDAAGEAAIFLSIRPECETSGDCANPNNAQWRASNAVSGGLIDSDNFVIESATADPYVGGDIVVTITYDYEMITVLMDDMFGTITLRATATQIVIVEP